jgi:hypothetical protein
MTSTPDKTEIDGLFRQLARAHVDHDADAIVEAYAPEAVIYDLAPPLGRRGLKRDSVAAWLGGWKGPIQIDAHDSIFAATVGWRSSQRLAECAGSGHVVSHDDVSSEDERAMANCLRPFVRALLHGWELSRSGGSQAVMDQADRVAAITSSKVTASSTAVAVACCRRGSGLELPRLGPRVAPARTDR